MSDKLTGKQDRFARNLFAGMSQRVAWIDAGYSSKYLPSVIDSNACRLAAESKIQARVLELQARADEKLIASVVERKQVATEIIRGRLADVVDEDGLVLAGALKKACVGGYEVTEWVNKAGMPVVRKKVTLRDPLAGIETLNKMERVGAADTIQNNTTNHYQIAVVTPGGEGLVQRLLAGERSTPELPNGGK